MGTNVKKKVLMEIIFLTNKKGKAALTTFLDDNTF